MPTLYRTVMVCICLVLVYRALDAWTKPIALLPPSAETLAEEVETVTLQPPQQVLGPISEFSEIVERPLFYADRRLPIETEEIVETNPTDIPRKKTRQRPDRLALTGVVIVGDTKIALISDGRSKKPTNMRIGEDIDGWKLARVFAEKIVLEKDGEQRELPLVIKGSKLTKKRKRTPKRRRREPEDDLEVDTEMDPAANAIHEEQVARQRIIPQPPEDP